MVGLLPIVTHCSNDNGGCSHLCFEGSSGSVEGSSGSVEGSSGSVEGSSGSVEGSSGSVEGSNGSGPTCGCPPGYILDENNKKLCIGE